jgi:hypothetical protein
MDRLHWLSETACIAHSLEQGTRENITASHILEEQEQLDREIAHLEQEVEKLVPFVLRAGMEEIVALHPVFLPLPHAIKALAYDQWFYPGCLQGRFFYRVDQYQYDEEKEQAVRVPVTYTRQAIHDRVDVLIRLPGDTRLAATIPLGLRVGQVVGWLSALAISQKEDAQAGMVLLATLVAPLLVCRDGKDHTSYSPIAKLNLRKQLGKKKN